MASWDDVARSTPLEDFRRAKALLGDGVFSPPPRLNFYLRDTPELRAVLSGEDTTSDFARRINALRGCDFEFHGVG